MYVSHCDNELYEFFLIIAITCMSLIKLIFFFASGCKSFSMSPRADASGTVLKALRKFAAWQGNPRDVSSM